MARTILLALLALAPAGAAEPAEDTAAWIQAAAAGRIAERVARLTEARRSAMALAWGDAAAGDRPDRRTGWDAPLRGLAALPPEEAAGALLAVLREAMDQPAAGTAAAAARDPRQAFLARMAGRALAGALPRSILAAGLEHRQGAVLQALSEGCAGWARTEGADPVRPAAMAPAMAALAAALAMDERGLSGLPMPAALGRADIAVPHLLDALAAAGLDARTMLAGSQVREESRSGTRAVVVVSFTAFAMRHELPIAVAEEGGAWTPVADSPLLRLLAPARPPWAGRARGGDGRPGRGPVGERPDDGPGPAAAPF